MSSLYLYQGKLLAVDGALATSENCCCSGEAQPEVLPFTIDWSKILDELEDIDTQ